MKKEFTSEEVLAKIKGAGRRYVQFHFTTLAGEMRGMEENADLIPKFAKSGISIDGSSIGVVDVNQSDIRLIPDWETYCTYEVDGETVDRVLCSIRYKGETHPACLRSLLRRTIARCNAMGFAPSMFGEIEWYFLNRDGTPHDAACYCSLPPTDKAQRIRHEIGDALEVAGCGVKRIHHENGPGQNEVELKLSPAMKNSDDLVTSMNIIGAVGERAGIVANFLPKPLKEEAGSGYHQHFALYDITTGKNVFAAPWLEEGTRKPDELLSDVGKAFTAGLLAHAEEITAVFARHEQSFERLKPGHEAPVLACWGTSNRTALVRVPDPSDAQDLRIEYRGGDASGATHLMCAVMLAAGLDGVEKKSVCPPEIVANADTLPEAEFSRYGARRLPTTLEEARKTLAESVWLREVLGETIVQFLMRNETPKKQPRSAAVGSPASKRKRR